MKLKVSTLKAKKLPLPILIEAARYGDSNAYEELLTRSYQSVYKYCCTMGSIDDALDLTQETYVRALKQKNIACDIKSVEGFLIHIARYVCCDYVRERVKTRSLTEKCMKQPQNDLFDDYDFIDDEICEESLVNISSDHREAFVLTQILKFPYEESALILNIPVGTIRSRVSRARETLSRNYKDNII